MWSKGGMSILYMQVLLYFCRSRYWNIHEYSQYEGKEGLRTATTSRNQTPLSHHCSSSPDTHMPISTNIKSILETRNRISTFPSQYDFSPAYFKTCAFQNYELWGISNISCYNTCIKLNFNFTTVSIRNENCFTY